MCVGLPPSHKRHRIVVRKNPERSFFRHHSLSIVSSIILLCWILLYTDSDPNTHWGSFFGNAIADWTGLVVTVIATKFMYEKGSVESRASRRTRRWLLCGKNCRSTRSVFSWSLPGQRG